MMRLLYNDSPLEYIDRLFRDTDEGGYLKFPSSPEDRPSTNGLFCRVRMNWDKDAYLQTRRDFAAFLDDLKAVAAVYRQDDCVEPTESVLREQLDNRLVSFWKQYLYNVPLDDTTSEITVKWYWYSAPDKIAETFGFSPLSPDETAALQKVLDKRFVSAREFSQYDRYVTACCRLAADQVGAPYAAPLRQCAYLYCKELSNRYYDPDYPTGRLIGMELAQNFVLHRHCVAHEYTETYRGVSSCPIEDWDIDRLFSSGGKADRTLIAPLFIYLLLRENKIENGSPLKAGQIAKRLAEYPYCIDLSHQKVSAVLSRFAGSGLSGRIFR